MSLGSLFDSVSATMANEMSALHGAMLGVNDILLGDAMSDVLTITRDAMAR